MHNYLQREKPKMPSPPVVAFGGGGKSSQVTGRGASAGADAGRWRGTCGLHSAVQSQADPYRWPARGSKLKRPTSRQNGRSTPARHLQERGAACWRHRSQVAQRGRYFRRTLAIMRARRVPGWMPSKSAALSHLFTAGRPMGGAIWLQRQCRPGRPLDTAPGSPAQRLCLNSRYIPSRAQ
jgi:hypothetical protein